MQVCTSLQTDNHANTPQLSFLQARCPSCRPTNSVKALKACESNEQCSTISAAARRPSWRLVCSRFTQLTMLLFDSWWHLACKCTQLQPMYSRLSLNWMLAMCIRSITVHVMCVCIVLIGWRPWFATRDNHAWWQPDSVGWRWSRLEPGCYQSTSHLSSMSTAVSIFTHAVL